MLVAITGATGFIGRRLVLENLEAGNAVRVLTRRCLTESDLPDAVRLYDGDLTGDVKILRDLVDGVDVVFHCAAETRDEACMHRVNVEGTRSLLEAASSRVGHWIQLSSVGVYGKVYGSVVTEHSPVKPVGSYEQSKAEADGLVMAASAKGRIDCTVLRPSIVFGPEMPNRSLVELTRMIKRGLFCFIGPVGASANYIHVKNVIQALLCCAHTSHDSGRVYNLSDHRSIEEFVTVIADELRVPVPKLRLPELLVRLPAKLLGRLPRFPLTEARVDALTNRTIYPIDRIQRELEYRHTISIEEGLRESVAAWGKDL